MLIRESIIGTLYFCLYPESDAIKLFTATSKKFSGPISDLKENEALLKLLFPYCLIQPDNKIIFNPHHSPEIKVKESKSPIPKKVTESKLTPPIALKAPDPLPVEKEEVVLKPEESTPVTSASVTESISLFKSTDELVTSLNALVRLPADIDDPQKNMDLFYALIQFIVRVGNINSGISFLNFAEKITSTQLPIQTLKKKLLAQQFSLRQEGIKSDSYIYSIRHSRSHFFITKKMLIQLKDKIKHYLPLSYQDKTPLISVFDSLIINPYNIERLTKTLIEMDFHFALKLFILRDYVIQVYANALLGLKFASHPIPNISLPPRPPRQKKEKPVVRESKEVLPVLQEECFPEISESKKKDEIKASTLHFSLPTPPAFLNEDNEFIKLRLSVERLNRTKGAQHHLEVAYNRLVLFRHHLLPLESSLHHPENQLEAKTYRRSLDSTYSAKLAYQLATHYIQDNKIEEAIEKLEWGRRLHYADYQCDELLITQYHALIPLSSPAQQASLLNAIKVVTEQLQTKKDYLATTVFHGSLFYHPEDASQQSSPSEPLRLDYK